MATLPIRIREVVRPDGSRARELLVFCPREGSSITPERCARCGFRCPPEAATPAPTIGCGAQRRTEEEQEQAPEGLLSGPHPAAERVRVGSASEQTVVCLRADVPLRVAGMAFDSARPWIAPPVVDPDGVLLGLLPKHALHADEACSSFMTVADAMSPTFSVLESKPLTTLISTMTSHNLRQVVIVDSARRVTGAVSDLEILRWVARGAPGGWR